MWLHTIDDIKKMIKLKCVVNGHGTKYWKQHLKQRLKLMKVLNNKKG